jgi:hypothetical protein
MSACNARRSLVACRGSGECIPQQLNYVPLACCKHRAVTPKCPLAPCHLHPYLLFFGHYDSFSNHHLSSNLAPWLWNPLHLVCSSLQALVLAAPISFDTVRCQALHFAGAGSPPHPSSVFGPLCHVLLMSTPFDAVLALNDSF